MRVSFEMSERVNKRAKASFRMYPSSRKSLRTLSEFTNLWNLKIQYIFGNFSARKNKTFKNSIILSIPYMAYVGGNVRSLETVRREELVRQCPDCGSKDIEYANEEFYCKKCGLVLD